MTHFNIDRGIRVCEISPFKYCLGLMNMRQSLQRILILVWTGEPCGLGILSFRFLGLDRYTFRVCQLIGIGAKTSTISHAKYPTL